jgi:dihydroxy-acid dehydratase
MQATSDRTPFIADLKPSGKYVMEDVHKARALTCICQTILRAWL